MGYNEAIKAPRPEIKEVFDYKMEQEGYQTQWLGDPKHDGGSWTDPAAMATTIAELTVHWSEAKIPAGRSDAYYLQAATDIAQFHYNKNWADPGYPAEYGDGAMYQYILAPTGLLLQTRPETRRTYNARKANERNLAICVLAGAGDKVQQVAVDKLEAFLNWNVYGRPEYPLLTAQPEQVQINGKGYKTFGVLTHDESLVLQGAPTKGCCGIYASAVKAWRARQPRLGGTPKLSIEEQIRNIVTYPFVAVPTITPEQFERSLDSRNSPALKERAANEYFNLCVRYGINPALALAFFLHESKAGTVGIAIQTQNWGNVRTPEDAALASGTLGGFTTYDSWFKSLEDWCKRIRGPKYLNGKPGSMTVGTAILKYAPASDGNTPLEYARDVQQLVSDWDHERSR